MTQKIPPLSDLIYKELSRTHLITEISERGRQLSAVECCEYFCTPPGLKTMLSAAMEGTDVKWGHYTSNAETALTELQNAGKLIQPYNIFHAAREILQAQPGTIITIGSTQFPNRKNFMKRGYTRRVKRYSRDNPVPLDDSIRESMRTVQLHQTFAGYDFPGVNYTNKSFEVIALIDIVRGIIYDAALHTTINARAYCGDKPLVTGARAGIVQIPSFHSPGKEYHVGLAGIGVYKDKKTDAASLGYDTNSTTDSPRELWEMVKFKRDIEERSADRTGYEHRWDHHTILAFQRAAKILQEDGWKVIKPYIEPSEKTIQTYWKILQHVLVREYDRRHEKIKLTSPTIAQAEHLLWKIIAYNNFEHNRKNN